MTETVDKISMQPVSDRNGTRQKLIEAGIEEINRHSVTGFSVRRVAAACGVSCATPARHFGDRYGFLSAIIDYVNAQWAEVQKEILAEHADSLHDQIVEVSMGYIQFLVDNPHFRSILMLKDEEFDNVYHKRRGEMSSPTQDLISAYCESLQIPEETRLRKVLIIRSLIFGSALMFDTGEIPRTEHTMQIMHQTIEQVLDQPDPEDTEA